MELDATPATATATATATGALVAPSSGSAAVTVIDPRPRPVLGRAVPLSFAQVRQRWPLLLPFLALLPLVLGAAAMVDGGRLLFWDAPLTAQAVAHRSPWIDQIALTISRLGAWPVVYPVGALLAALAARRSRTLAAVILVVVATRPAFEWLLKDLVARPRPVGDRLVDGTGYSFPSGHVLAAAATWAFLPPVLALYTRSRALWWAAVGLAGSIIGLVAWTRVWLGVHWTSDVLASLAIAFVALSAAEARLHRNPERPGSFARRGEDLSASA